jgi:hypothetical protein
MSLWCSLHGQSVGVTDQCELSTYVRDCWMEAQRKGGQAAVIVSAYDDPDHVAVFCDSDDLGWMEVFATAAVRALVKP